MLSRFSISSSPFAGISDALRLGCLQMTYLGRNPPKRAYVAVTHHPQKATEAGAYPLLASVNNEIICYFKCSRLNCGLRITQVVLDHVVEVAVVEPRRVPSHFPRLRRRRRPHHRRRAAGPLRQSGADVPRLPALHAGGQPGPIPVVLDPGRVLELAVVGAPRLGEVEVAPACEATSEILQISWARRRKYTWMTTTMSGIASEAANPRR